MKSLSHVCLFEIPSTVAYQALLSMDFPGKNTGVGCHFLLQEIFLTQGLNRVSCIVGRRFTIQATLPTSDWITLYLPTHRADSTPKTINLGNDKLKSFSINANQIKSRPSNSYIICSFAFYKINFLSLI